MIASGVLAASIVLQLTAAGPAPRLIRLWLPTAYGLEEASPR